VVPRAAADYTGHRPSSGTGRARSRSLREHGDGPLARLASPTSPRCTRPSEFVEGTNRQIKWLVTFAAAWSSVLVTAVRFIP
jgi:hypothetical protein